MIPDSIVNAPVKSLELLLSTIVPGPLPAAPCVQLPVPVSLPVIFKVTPALEEISAPLPGLKLIVLGRSITELTIAVDPTVAWDERTMVTVLAAQQALRLKRPEVMVRV